MSMSMSMVTDRVVLSSIDDNRLNSKFNKSIIPLLPKSKSTLSSSSSSSSFTKSNSKLYKSDAQSISNLRSGIRSNANSFSIFNSESHDTDVDDDNDNGNDNDKDNDDDNDVEAYASKLKFKLRKAIVRLNQQKKLPKSSTKFSPSLSNSSTKLYHKSKGLINQKSIGSSKITKPFSFKNSVNINLTKPNSIKSKPNSPLKNSLNLSNFIREKQSKRYLNQSHLKLFSIKKESPFYSNQKLPLTANQTNQPSQTNQQNQSNQPAHHQNNSIPFISVSSIGSFHDSNTNDKIPETSLPPINKILKTPLKLTSVHTNHPEYQPNNDDNDQTIDDETIDESTKKYNSSPLKHFATPNSFSVAKSLLQLGSGYYN